MSKKQRIVRPKARLPKGMRDVLAVEARATERMLAKIRAVYELYGFEPLETPAFEYSDALGKFLPDQDRPNAGVFSFEDEDGQWLSLRYDLTAPLARYVAENYDGLPKPFRRYQTGDVFRNEKPGPGRFRQFRQFDADTVGTANVSADAEICMLAAETIERLGIARGDFRIRVNNRKVLDGVLLGAGIDPGDASTLELRQTVLRAIDKLDRLGPDGVAALLGEGRRDDSGDYTEGAKLQPKQIDQILGFTLVHETSRDGTLGVLEDLVAHSERGLEGHSELSRMNDLLDAAGFGADRVTFDTTIVRGLDYYTGPVFEAELTFDAEGEDGTLQRFGSVGGGGRYDGLVARFKGVEVPATGFSVGVSRLASALAALGKLAEEDQQAPVVVLVLDADRTADSQAMVHELRAAGIRSEMYLGTSGMRAQMKYADRRDAPCVVIEGEDERAAGEVTLKDLREGKRLSADISDNAEWRESRPAQISVRRGELVSAVREVLSRCNHPEAVG